MKTLEWRSMMSFCEHIEHFVLIVDFERKRLLCSYWKDKHRDKIGYIIHALCCRILSVNKTY